MRSYGHFTDPMTARLRAAGPLCACRMVLSRIQLPVTGTGAAP
jgi:hypothetical protein